MMRFSLNRRVVVLIGAVGITIGLHGLASESLAQPHCRPGHNDSWLCYARPATPASPQDPLYYPGDPRLYFPPNAPQYIQMEQLEQTKRATLLQFALAVEGQYVDFQPGHHECADFVQRAITSARMVPGDTSSPDGRYRWGRKINFPTEPALPGDVIQLVNVHLSYRTANASGDWDTPTQHSALILSTEEGGRKLNVIQQNAPPGSPVNRGVINLNWNLDRGDYAIYRPYVLPN